MTIGADDRLPDAAITAKEIVLILKKAE